jgi:pyruvate/2-oxoglutarate dehydrogenase complex dihydrolipoamide acyltransferase (E2) component
MAEQQQSTGTTGHRGRRKRWPWALACVVVLLIIGAVAGGKNKSATASHHATAARPASTASHPTAPAGHRSAGVPASEKEARAWISEHGSDAQRVQASFQVVQIEIGTLEKAGGEAAVNEVAQSAQSAHDEINEVRNDFATTETSGPVGTAAVEVFTAANELKNAMGAMVAYTGNPNPATLAHFTSQYAPSRGEWDHGITTIWRLARQHNPPTI